MANTIAQVEHDLTGIGSPKLFIFTPGATTAALNNAGSGDDLTLATNRLSEWRATISESLADVYRYEVRTGSTLVAHGWIKLADDTNTYYGHPTKFEAENSLLVTTVATLLTRANRVDGLIEDDSGDQFTEKALYYSLGGSSSDGETRLASGTLQSATATTAVLASATSFADDLINNRAMLVITGGTGAKQVRLITDWVSSTDTATVDAAWVTTPDNTSTYVVLPVVPGTLKTGAIADTTFAAVEGTRTLYQSLRLMMAVLLGKTTGFNRFAQTNEVEFLAADGTTTRITANTDIHGNRTTITIDEED